MRGIFEKEKGSGIWYISYCDAEGHRHREKVGRRSVALEVYVNRKREIREGRFVAPARTVSSQKLSFEELVEQALAWKKTRTELSTHYHDRININVLLDRGKLKGLALAQVTSARVAQTFRLLFEAGLTGGTVNRYRNTLSSIFTYAVKTLKILPANPVAAVEPFKENEHRIRFLDRDEENAVRASIRERFPIDGEQYLAELDLALNTGMRMGEQFTLTWQNVDLERGILTVRGKKGRRFIPVNSAVRAALLVLHAASHGSSSVTHPRRRQNPVLPLNGKPQDRRRWFRKSCDAAGVENFVWHDLRHTFASRLVMAGVDIRTVQELLGHRSILQTMKYAHLAPSHNRAAVERLVPTLDLQVAPEVAPGPMRAIEAYRKPKISNA